MKISFAAICTLFLGASMVSAALEPRATKAASHTHSHKHTKTHSHSSKSSKGEVFDLSAILANPSSYLKSASKAFKNPKFASEFAKETAKPSFQKSLSRELVSQFGSKTASIALQQYTAVLNQIDKGSSASSAGIDASAATPTSNVVAAQSVSSISSVSATSAAATSTADTQVLGSQNGASPSNLISIGILGSAISLGAVVVLAAI